MTIIALATVAIVLIIYDIIVVALFSRGFVMGHILWHNCGAS